MNILSCLAALALCAFCSAGIKPRADSSDYRQRRIIKGTTIAAEAVPASQVQSTFATDLTRDYLVVEVAVYPGADGSITLGTSDFLLHCGAERIRPGSPNAIAEHRHRQNAPKRSDVDIYPVVGIGYESGNDPVIGRRHGVYTTGGVAVPTGGSGNPRSASTDQDRRTMALELEEKQLPEGSTVQPVAGYLYLRCRPTSRRKPP